MPHLAQRWLSFSLLTAALCSSPATAQQPRPRGELGSVSAQLEFNPNKEWFGQLYVTGVPPETEGIQSVVLEVLFPGEGDVFVLDGMWPGVYVSKPDSREAVDGSDLFQTVGLGQVSSDGAFKLPFIRSAPPRSLFRIRPTGRFLAGGGLHFGLDDKRPPDFTRPLIINAVVGYAAEFRLHLPEDATAYERSALAGRRLSFLGESQGNYSTEQYERMLELEAIIEEPKGSTGGPLIARIERIGLQPLTFDSPGSTTKREACLEPFYVSAIPKIEPAPGKEVVCHVQLKRGVVLAGTVRDGEGRPIERARINISCVRVRDRPDQFGIRIGPRDGLMHRILNQDILASTDGQGRFIARAVPADFTGLHVSVSSESVLGARSLWVDAKQVSVGERANLQLVLADR